MLGVSEFIDEPWLSKTVPLRTEEIGCGHEIHEKANIFDLMSNFNLGFKLFFFYFSTLLISLILFLIIKVLSNETIKVSPTETISRNSKISKLKSAKVSSFSTLLFNNHKLSIKVFLLFFGLFQWHTSLFITNTIKTNKASTSIKDS